MNRFVFVFSLLYRYYESNYSNIYSLVPFSKQSSQIEKPHKADIIIICILITKNLFSIQINISYFPFSKIVFIMNLSNSYYSFFNSIFLFPYLFYFHIANDVCFMFIYIHNIFIILRLDRCSICFPKTEKHMLNMSVGTSSLLPLNKIIASSSH